ncbi:MAG TPA: FtsX-like permease family protein [Polyangiaceae bacterium]|nr:FtsX-like permease family protein [Polyangiaceae bacterium]
MSRTIPALERKWLRELRQLRGQVLTIALVVASGLVTFISMRGTYESLDEARAAHYERARFADVFALAKRVPESVARQLESLPAVARLETRIVEEITLPIEGMARPAYGQILSIPHGREPVTNVPQLRYGRWPERGRDDEVVVLDSFAGAHGLREGDELPAVLNGKLRRLIVVGVALSPEYVFAIRPGALADDPKRYAVLWMDRSTLAAAFDLEGAFNELSLELQPGTPEERASLSLAVRAQIDRALAPYGGDGAFDRKDQLSNRIVNQELSQLRALAGMIPLVFLAVAAFLLNLVLGRLIRLQRPEIATLKAIGYSSRQVALHYLRLVLAVLLPGSVLGVAGGLALGRVVLGLYATSFRFPDLRFHASAALLVSGVLVSAIAGTVGALGAVRAAAKLPPAEAMRPPAPPHYRQGWLERLQLGALLGPSGLMVFREVQRRPFRTLLSSLGIAGAVALLILGRFGWDSLLYYFERTFDRAQRQDLQVVFRRPLPPRVVTELAGIPGVARAEGLRAVPIRARQNHRMRDSVLMGLPDISTLRQLIAKGGRAVPIPSDGVLLTKTLGELLQLQVGDRLEIELREGERRLVQAPIAGFIDETIGLSVYASRGLVDQLSGDQGAISSVLLQIEPADLPAVEARLRRSPEIIDVSDVHADKQRMFDMNARIMNVWTAISIGLAASVAFGVVYNNARINLGARERELASLRVLGFSRREVSAVLLASLALEVLIAIPIGLVLGHYWAVQFMGTVDPETFRWEVIIAPSTYLLVILVILLAASASAFWVRRNVDRFDLMSVLKARD